MDWLRWNFRLPVLEFWFGCCILPAVLAPLFAAEFLETIGPPGLEWLLGACANLLFKMPCVIICADLVVYRINGAPLFVGAPLLTRDDELL